MKRIALNCHKESTEFLFFLNSAIVNNVFIIILQKNLGDKLLLIFI